MSMFNSEEIEKLRSLLGSLEKPSGTGSMTLSADLIDPALKGALNVLNSCSKSSSTVKRVVVISSMAAVWHNERPRNPDVLVDETWFSNQDLCKEKKVGYVLSKTLAEEAAWEFAKDHDIDLVTINPAMVLGPLLQPALNTSNEAVLKLIHELQMMNPLPNLSCFEGESEGVGYQLHAI